VIVCYCAANTINPNQYIKRHITYDMTLPKGYKPGMTQEERDKLLKDSIKHEQNAPSSSVCKKKIFNNRRTFVLWIIGVGVPIGILVLFLKLFQSYDNPPRIDLTDHSYISFIVGHTAFLPVHAIVTIVSILIFIAILLVINEIQRSNPKDENKEDIKENQKLPVKGADIGSIVTLLGLVITLGGSLIAVYINFPVLDYGIEEVNLPYPYESPDNLAFRVDLNNYGFAKAENTIVSIDPSQGSITNFIPDTVIYNHYNATNSSNSRNSGIIEIENLPPLSTTSFVTIMNKSLITEKSNIYVNVRSDESTGKFNSFYLFIYYAILAAICFAFPLLFWLGRINRCKNLFFLSFSVALVIIICMAIIAGLLYKS
jgi:hypothetical protein